MATYRRLALDIALREVGVKEDPPDSNSGARVQQYQSTTNLGGTGWPWCAAFINWIFVKAGRPLDELDRQASVGFMLAKAKARGWAHSGTPQVGDIVCYDWNTLAGPTGSIGDEWSDHVGIVSRVNADGSFQAVEGNTAIGNDSNGGQVMIRDRRRSQVEGFIRVPGGFRIQRRWRISIWRKDVRESIITDLWLAGALRRLPGLLRGLEYGERLQVRPYKKRIELPDV